MIGCAASWFLAWKPWKQAFPGSHECVSYIDTKWDVIKTWATVIKQEEGFCVSEMKKKVILETSLSRKSDAFYSFCSFIDSGTIERKQISRYLGDSSYLLIVIISRSLSYLSAVDPWWFLWDSMICRVHRVQPLRRELENAIEEAVDFLQMLAIGGRSAFAN